MGSGASGLDKRGGAGGGAADILNTKRGRAYIDSIEEAEEEMRGRGIEPGDTSEFWSNAYDRDVESLYDEFGYDYDGRYADSVPKSIQGANLKTSGHVTGNSLDALNSELNKRGLAFKREYRSSTSHDLLMDMVGSDGKMYTGTLDRYFDGGLDVHGIKLRPYKSGSRR